MKILFLGIVIIFSISTISAQQREISGRVTSALDAEPLPGANVLIMETGNGTITDAEGNFSIEAGPEGQNLQVSFIGMLTEEISITEESYYEISLIEDLARLDEVVVVAYGRESKKLLSNSVTTINQSDINNLPTSELNTTLAGRAAGVQVLQNSGTPGGASTVRVRGISSIKAGTQPLYVIDGIPIISGDYSQLGFSGQTVDALSDLNPADIESISILKDASATALYGARASNGIVLITTKRGTNEKTRVNINAYKGIQMVERKLDMLNAEQWMEYRNDLQVNSGGIPIYSQQQIDTNKTDTDWLDEIFRMADISNAEISASGGNEKTSFYLGGSIFGQEGIVLGTDYMKGSGRVNLDHKANSKLSFGMSYGLSYTENNRKEGDQSLNGPVPNAISLSPLYPVRNEDGSYNEDGPYANPVSIANEQINTAFSFRNLGNIYAEVKLLDGLKFTTKWGVDYLNYREHSYDPTTTRQGAKYNGLGFETTSEAYNFTSNNLLDYYKEFEEHKIGVLMGYSFENFKERNSYIRGQDFPNENFQYITSAGNITEASATAVDEGLNSYFGRIKYNLSDKYIFEASVRADGSSKFAKKYQYGYFPAVSAAYRISEEEFFPQTWLINDFKIRASYGLSGNDRIQNFGFYKLYSSGANYENRPGLYPSQLENPDLKWESTSQFNLGTDIVLVSNRVSLTFDYYHKYTKDLLLDRPLPPSSGYTSYTQNIGEMVNYGYEIQLNTLNINRDLKWNSVLNLSSNKNEVVKLYEGIPIDDIGRGGNRIEEGEPIGIFYAWKSLGVDPTTGDIVFADIKPDGVITAEDRTKIGSPHPIFTGGFTNIFSYKFVSLNIFLQFSYGNDVYNGTREYIESLKGQDNQTTEIIDRWEKPGDITDIPRATVSDLNNNSRRSSRYLEDGSYCRIKNVKLNFSVPTELINKIKLQKLDIYISGQNLYTFTNYSGMDPEVNYAGTESLRFGTDFFTYPQARTITLGINVGF